MQDSFTGWIHHLVPALKMQRLNLMHLNYSFIQNVLTDETTTTDKVNSAVKMRCLQSEPRPHRYFLQPSPQTAGVSDLGCHGSKIKHANCTQSGITSFAAIVTITTVIVCFWVGTHKKSLFRLRKRFGSLTSLAISVVMVTI